MNAPYRTDRDALEGRLAALDKELEALRAQKRHLSSVNEREAQVAREAEEVRKKLLQARRTATVSLLDGVRVASPCSAGWDNMKGDDRVRFCGLCEKNVYDLSQMTRDEAERFVRENEAPGACIRLHRRKDGTILTADCAVGARRVLRLRVVGAVAGVSMLGAAVAAWTMIAPDQKARRAMDGDLDDIKAAQIDDVVAVDGQMHVTAGMMVAPGRDIPPEDPAIGPRPGPKVHR